MLSEIVRPIAQKLLQARVDGHLDSDAQILQAIQAHQPASGLSTSDFALLAQFIGELEPCRFIPGARLAAAKYDLVISL